MAGAMIDLREAGAPVAVVDPDDQTAATDVLSEFFTGPRWLERTKTQSQAWAAENLGWNRYTEQLETVYRPLVSSRRAR
jgi:glycosyltransferase involved in cell wall biosynthesis